MGPTAKAAPIAEAPGSRPVTECRRTRLRCHVNNDKIFVRSAWYLTATSGDGLLAQSGRLKVDGPLQFGHEPKGVIRMESEKYFAADADLADERVRLGLIESDTDPITTRSLSAIGITRGWRCLEVGAGGGSITRWMAEQVGDAGKASPPT